MSQRHEIIAEIDKRRDGVIDALKRVWQCFGLHVLPIPTQVTDSTDAWDTSQGHQLSSHQLTAKLAYVACHWSSAAPVKYWRCSLSRAPDDVAASWKAADKYKGYTVHEARLKTNVTAIYEELMN